MLGRYNNCITNFSRKSAEKRPLGTPRPGWEDNIKMYLKEGVCMWTTLKIVWIHSNDQLF
jgi:hypothetical protein